MKILRNDYSTDMEGRYTETYGFYLIPEDCLVSKEFKEPYSWPDNVPEFTEKGEKWLEENNFHYSGWNYLRRTSKEDFTDFGKYIKEKYEKLQKQLSTVTKQLERYNKMAEQVSDDCFDWK